MEATYFGYLLSKAKVIHFGHLFSKVKFGVYDGFVCHSIFSELQEKINFYLRVSGGLVLSVTITMTMTRMHHDSDKPLHLLSAMCMA